MLSVVMVTRFGGSSHGPWCGECYANVKGRANYAGHALYATPGRRKEEACMSLKKCGPPGKNGSGSRQVSSQSKYLAEFSDLMEFLSSVSWEDGSPREPGTLSLTVTEGRWNGRLKDTANGRYVYLTGSTVDELLESLEVAVNAPETNWRADKPYPRK